MNLRHLEHWLALAEWGSFSRAADKLHITQSALSRSIQVLEQELGGPLVDRIGKRNEPTPLGRSLLARARRIVLEVAEIKLGAATLQAGAMGSLRVGMGSGPGAMLMTPWLVHMARAHPGIQVSVSRGPAELQLQQLRQRELDVLVVDVRRIAPAADLRIGPRYDLAAGLLCRSGHPLLALYPQGVPFAALLDYPLACTPLSDEVARLLVERYGPAADPARMISLQCEEIPSLLQTVRETDAIYLGIVGAAREALALGHLQPLPVTPHLNVGACLALVSLAGRTELPLMAQFRQFVDAQLAPSCIPAGTDGEGLDVAVSENAKQLLKGNSHA